MRKNSMKVFSSSIEPPAKNEKERKLRIIENERTGNLVQIREFKSSMRPYPLLIFAAENQKNGKEKEGEMGEMELICTLKGHEDRVWDVAWHPEGHLLASCGGDKSIRLWKRDGLDNTSWKCVEIKKENERTVRRVQFSRDGKKLASCSFDGTVSIWNVDLHTAKLHLLATLEGHENEVKACDWNYDSSLIATCSRDKTVWIWEYDEDTEEFETVAVLYGHAQDVKNVVWHPSKPVLVSCSYDDTLRMWMDSEAKLSDDGMTEESEDAIEEWEQKHQLVGHKSTVWDFSFDPSGSRIASCSEDTTIKVWKYDHQQEKWIDSTTISGFHSRPIYSIDWSVVSGFMVTGAGDDSIRIFKESDDRENGFDMIAHHRKAHQSDVNCVKWNPKNNLLVSGGDDCAIKIWKYEFKE